MGQGKENLVKLKFHHKKYSGISILEGPIPSDKKIKEAEGYDKKKKAMRISKKTNPRQIL